MVIQHSLMMFQEFLRSKESVKTYTFLLDRFRKYHSIKDYDSIVSIDEKELQKMVETYVIYLKKTISPNTVSTYANPIKTFLEANDIDLNWRKIKRLYPALVKRSGSSAYSTQDVKKMLDVSTKIRNKAVIHFLASSGVRIGALPELKLKHLRDMPNDCKMVTVYEDSTEEYQTFLTPEATKVLEEYFDQRRKNNEILNEESPLFRERYLMGTSKPYPISKRAIQGILTRAITNANVRGQKKNGRYSEQLAHGFRKRFNTILKLNNEVNDNAIEKMMGHKNGLDGTYFQGTIEQLFNEFEKGIQDLTISDEERDKVKINKLESEKSELEKAKLEYKHLSEKHSNFKNDLENLIPSHIENLIEIKKREIISELGTSIMTKAMEQSRINKNPDYLEMLHHILKQFDSLSKNRDNE